MISLVFASGHDVHPMRCPTGASLSEREERVGLGSTFPPIAHRYVAWSIREHSQRVLGLAVYARRLKYSAIDLLEFSEHRFLLEPGFRGILGES